MALRPWKALKRRRAAAIAQIHALRDEYASDSRSRRKAEYVLNQLIRQPLIVGGLLDWAEEMEERIRYEYWLRHHERAPQPTYSNAPGSHATPNGRSVPARSTDPSAPV